MWCIWISRKSGVLKNERKKEIFLFKILYVCIYIYIFILHGWWHYAVCTAPVVRSLSESNVWGSSVVSLMVRIPGCTAFTGSSPATHSSLHVIVLKVLCIQVQKWLQLMNECQALRCKCGRINELVSSEIIVIEGVSSLAFCKIWLMSFQRVR